MSDYNNLDSRDTVRRLSSLLETPDDHNTLSQLELFRELAKKTGGVTALVFHLHSTTSLYVMRTMAALLTEVEAYPDEINALYLWIDSRQEWSDENSVGNLATAVQRHIALLDLTLPPEPEMQRVMISFLSHCLMQEDWTIRDAALGSFDSLDGRRSLEEWLTSEQVTTLQAVLAAQIQAGKITLEPEEIGRLQRLVSPEI